MTNFGDHLSTNVIERLRQPKLPLIPLATVRTTPTTAEPTSRSQMLQRMRDSQSANSDKSNNSSAKINAAMIQDKMKDESLKKKINLRISGSSTKEAKKNLAPPLPPSSQQATSEQRMAPNNKIGAGNEEVWSSVEDLFWDHMKEVQNKWNTLKLNDDIWAKLIYFEQNRRIAKAYVSAPVLTVDGSANGLDGFRIGLSGIENNYRTLDSMSCLRSIGQGIKLKIDNQGNILIRKLGNLLNGNANQLQPSIVHPSSSSAASSIAASSSSSSLSSSASSSASTSSNSSSALSNSRAQCSVWIKDWPSNSSSTNTTSGSCMMREIEKSDVSYKLFDMRKFRLQLENRRLNNENFIDWRQCVSVISFVQNLPEQQSQKTAAGEKRQHQGMQHGKLLEDPCWLMIINIIAIDMLKSSVCDRYNSLSPTSQPSETFSLIHNNQSLSTAAARSSASSRLNGLTNKANPLGPSTHQSSLGQAESTSLAAAKQQGKKQGQYSDNDSKTHRLFNKNSSNGGSAGNLLASERLKKLRSTSSRCRMNIPGMNKLGGDESLSNYRRYQSAQQLSPTNSNSIYTTFNSNSNNSKFMNSPLASTKLHQQNHHNYLQLHQHQHQHQHQHLNHYNPVSHSHFRTGLGGDNSSLSTSDYHSASRSTSSSQNNYYHLIQQNAHNNRSSSPAHYHPLRYHPNRQLKQFEKQATKNINLHNYHDDGRVMFTRKAQLSSKTKNLSLSNSDLSPRQSRLDFSAIRSSIKMNFDYFDGEDDVGDDEDCDAIIDLCQQQQQQQPQETDFDDIENQQQSCCELTEELKQSQVNHHECQASHGQSSESKQSQLPIDDDEQEEGHEETKTKEQQRQQKISRSSIGSNSTASSGCVDNDYFTSQSSSSMSSSTGSNERDLFSQPASSSGIAGSSGNTSDEYTYETNKLSPDCSEAEVGDKLANVNDDTTKATHNKQKTLVATTDTTTKVSDIKKQSGVGAKLHRRGYRVKHVEEPLIAGDFCCDCALTESDESYECDCCCDCVYSESLANNQITSAAKAVGATLAVESALDGSQSMATTCGCDDESSIYCRLPHPVRLSNNSKQRQATSWLERRRRYGVMLTRSSKFYLPNGNNGLQVNDFQERTQRRSNDNHLNNKEDKFRLTRSTQELSS